jgi:methionyl aminopeptidase
MSITTPAELDALRAAGAVAAEVLAMMRAAAIAGVRPTELDALGESVMHARGARSAPRLAVQFPAATCISVNSEIAHGIPTTIPLRDGDLVNIDVSLELDGFWADMGASLAVGTPSPEVARLLAAGEEALAAALAEVRHGARLNRIGRAAEAVATRHGYIVIEDLCGHGVGRSLHEEPLEVYSHFVPDDRRRMRRGQVLAIEPFLSTGARHVTARPDGWTLATDDGGLAVQFEHTVLVLEEGMEILTVAGG